MTVVPLTFVFVGYLVETGRPFYLSVRLIPFGVSSEVVGDSSPTSDLSVVDFEHLDSTGGWSSLSIDRSLMQELIAEHTKCVSVYFTRANTPVRTGEWLVPAMHEWMLLPTVLTPIVVVGGKHLSVSVPFHARLLQFVDK